VQCWADVSPRPPSIIATPGSIESLNIHTGQPIHAGYIIRSYKQTFDSVSAVITVKVEKK